jgi:hypothetical protein
MCGVLHFWLSAAAIDLHAHEAADAAMLWPWPVGDDRVVVVVRVGVGVGVGAGVRVWVRVVAICVVLCGIIFECTGRLWGLGLEG